MGPTETQLRKKINDFKDLKFWELINESAAHSRNESESHFVLTAVSESFEGQTLVQRHQELFTFLKEIVAQIHSFSMNLYTPEEWCQKEKKPNTPKCRGLGR